MRVAHFCNRSVQVSQTVGDLPVTGESKKCGGVIRMYAVIQTGGKQYRVTEGSILKVEKLDAQPGDRLTLDQVLMVSDGNEVRVGTPLVPNAQVTAVVLEQGREKKIVVFKYKRRKNYRRKQGHRQPYTKIKVEKIEG
jgi:large subunit ribosomal protein L21